MSGKLVVFPNLMNRLNKALSRVTTSPPDTGGATFKSNDQVSFVARYAANGSGLSSRMARFQNGVLVSSEASTIKGPT